jgi:toxin ParE1/3/4
MRPALLKVLYQQAASDDVVRQFRHYLVTLNLPDVAIRFRTAVRQTLQSLQLHPLVGPRYRSRNPRLQNLRSWAVKGFEAIRIYYLLDEDNLRIVRILHGRRDVQRILEGDKGG